MRHLLAVLLAAAILAMPVTAFAADFSININFSRADDGTASAELLFNSKVIWRLQVLADGARPVSSGRSENTTFITPDIENGLFLIKVHHNNL